MFGSWALYLKMIFLDIWQLLHKITSCLVLFGVAHILSFNTCTILCSDCSGYVTSQYFISVTSIVSLFCVIFLKYLEHSKIIYIHKQFNLISAKGFVKNFQFVFVFIHNTFYVWFDVVFLFTEKIFATLLLYDLDFLTYIFCLATGRPYLESSSCKSWLSNPLRSV